MNYIGSKHKLSAFIIAQMKKHVPSLAQKTFAELFAGTGIIARRLKKEAKKIIVNDVEPYSYALLKNYIGNQQLIPDIDHYAEKLQELAPQKGFIFEQYSAGGKAERQYFTAENGQMIDAIRLTIKEWKGQKMIEEDIYYMLLTSLLESADKVANTASVYGAYLKHIKKSAQKPLCFSLAYFEESNNEVQVFQQEANQLINTIQGDVLYLDPPYNARQYGANYHLLNTIALYDSFQPQGKTGLRDYQKSPYCQKNEAPQALEDLLQKADFEHVFMSYNNEGIIPIETIQQIFKQFGKYELQQVTYQRFKADKDQNRTHKSQSTYEYLHILTKK
ncbi:MAG: modification methylase [Cytophagales bacterium]|nr:MAG: modification methylase [Cytophagales bacterium]